MTGRDHLIIKVVLVYRLNENLRLKQNKVVPLRFLIRYLAAFHLSPAANKKYTFFVYIFEETRILCCIPWRGKQKYQVTKVSSFKFGNESMDDRMIIEFAGVSTSNSSLEVTCTSSS